LYYFNKTEADIWFRAEFDKIASSDVRFTMKHILSEPKDDTWTGAKGRISQEIVDEAKNMGFTFAMICGSISFNTEAIRLLEQCNTSIHIECFQG
jgi:NAD(P)H-flavin reductase